MDNESPTCPYCNAFVPVDPAAKAGQRVPCPRCGEAFTLRQPTVGTNGVQVMPSVLTAPSAVDFDMHRRLQVGTRKRITAAAVLGVMGLMAAIGLAYALYTVHDRRVHDTAMPPPHHRSPLQDLAMPTPAVTPPAALEALRWLPPDVTVVAGVQVAELRQTDAGRDLMNHLFRVGKVEINADLLERWTGLRPEEIDHIVLGVKADEGIPPSAVLVVRTVRPYNAEAVHSALGAEPAPAVSGKTLYQCKPGDGGLRPFLWCADERTLVFSLFEKPLEAVPDKPSAGLERLPADVRMLLEERLDSAGPGVDRGPCRRLAQDRRGIGARRSGGEGCRSGGPRARLRAPAASGATGEATGVGPMRRRRRGAAAGDATDDGEAGRRGLEGGAGRAVADVAAARRP